MAHQTSVSVSQISVPKAITNEEIFDAAIAAPNPFAGHAPDPNLYGDPRLVEPTEIEFMAFKAYQIYNPKNPDWTMYVASDDGMSKVKTDVLKIAYSRWEKPDSTGPFLLINHGVPANQTQWYDIARMLALVGFRVVVFDMLCMGWSSKPLFENVEEKKEKLRWDYDVLYVDALADFVFGKDAKFVYMADDWGAGIMHKYMEKHYNRVLWFGDQDGIRGGAYPVPEIEDIGRASFLPMEKFIEAMGSADSSITQTLKTMAFRSSKKYDQWSMRDILRPFFSQDYERTYLEKDGPGSPYSMPHKVYALKSMADRAGTALISLDLMPFHKEKNPRGIKYADINTTLYLWSGENDNMMSRNQRFRYQYWMPNSRVFHNLIPRAGHFSGVDQPKRIATNVITFHQLLYPPGGHAQEYTLPAGFLGFDGTMKGSEREESVNYEKLYM
jgi:pimeloyl-ACP methyl ester carboxylesterase